jgi:hypothetical protein
MFYLRWAESDINKLASDGIQFLFTEVNSEGRVLREIGFDEAGRVAHRCPGKGKFGTYGLFDLAPIETSNLKSELSSEEFEKLWSQESSV